MSKMILPFSRELDAAQTRWFFCDCDKCGLFAVGAKIGLYIFEIVAVRSKMNDYDFETTESNFGTTYRQYGSDCDR